MYRCTRIVRDPSFSKSNALFLTPSAGAATAARRLLLLPGLASLLQHVGHVSFEFLLKARQFGETLLDPEGIDIIYKQSG